MRILVVLALIAAAAFAASNKKKEKPDEWHPIFDGSTLDGWKASDHAESWSVKDGAIRGDGPGSYLFYMKEICQNCEFKAEVRINHGGNSGMFFRSPFSKSPGDYEAQVDSTHRDPVKTGSLYHFAPILEVLIPDDTWFTQHIVVEGNHIQIFVNDKQTVDFIDEKNTKTDGLLALQQHNAGSVVEFKNLTMKQLPPPKLLLSGTWRLDAQNSRYSAGSPPQRLDLRILEERDGFRFQSVMTGADGKRGGVNFFGRLDGYDYVASGASDFDHVSLEEIDKHHIHEALQAARIRKKPDEHYYLMIERRGFKEVGRATCTLSADRKSWREEGEITKDSGEKVTFTEVFNRVETRPEP
ncbi:MAG TPA: DUF1080 domain-containing protein [Bryobacteraceae bacterium]|nr:DUF1080 domain-containing protein [Bryobacteraceae bacterium]